MATHIRSLVPSFIKIPPPLSEEISMLDVNGRTNGRRTDRRPDGRPEDTSLPQYRPFPIVGGEG